MKRTAENARGGAARRNSETGPEGASGEINGEAVCCTAVARHPSTTPLSPLPNEKKNINEEEDRFLTRVWTSALFFSLSPKRIRLIVANYTKASSAR